MKTFFLSIMLFLCMNCFAQSTDTSGLEQYCEMICTQRLLSTKVNIAVNFGEKINYWKDRRLKDSLGKVVNFNSLVDAMNYMGKLGWKLQTSLLVGSSGSYEYHYIFRKIFDSSELE